MKDEDTVDTEAADTADGATAADNAVDAAAAEPAVDTVKHDPAAAKRPDQSIVACPDGPLLVRGDFEIVTPTGEPLPRNRKTVALCRCGASIIKPYCDGTHKLIGFRTDD